MAKRGSRSSSGRKRKRSKSGSRGRALSGPVQALKSLLSRGAASLLNRLKARRTAVGGLLMVALGLYTFFAFFSPSQGAVGTSWLRVLRFLLGWGMLLFPLLMIALGLWLLLRNIEAELPELHGEQILGAAMLLLALLMVLQAGTGVATLEGGTATARAGRGGGLLGTALLAPLVAGFGALGTGVMLAVWILLAAVFASGNSVPWLLARMAAGADRAAAAVRTALWSPSAERSWAPEVGGGPPASPAQPSEVGTDQSWAVGQSIPSPPAPENVSVAGTQWKLPKVSDLLDPGDEGRADKSYDRDRAALIEETLKSFGAPARVVEINRGPTITQFGVEPAFVEGRGGRRVKVKVSKISSLADDLALALAAPSIRIEAPVPGKGFVGIEVPNPEVSLVALRDVMESEAFGRIDSRLRIGLGRDVSGSPVAADLASMPHLLLAGTTGSGKSVAINAIVSCLLLQNTPDQLRMIMVDPKRVELTAYGGVPHLLAPVVVDLERVVPVMQWISREMDERYRRFSEIGVRNIADYNEQAADGDEDELPYLVLIVDELADLMMMAPDETERVLTRLAQLARATGIHLVIATQRPSVDVVTGLIKANFPARIAFAVASSVDSRVILDQPGAERLLGSGDMLFQAPDAAMPRRLQGVYVSEVELERLMRYWKTESVETVEGEREGPPPSEPLPTGASLKQAPLWEEIEEEAEEVDELYEEAVDLVRRRRRASISMLQRRLRIGYTRSARLIDQMERRGIVGPEPGGSKAREVLDYGEFEGVEE